MPDRYEVRIRVISQKGFCASGHKVGDEWVIQHDTPPGLCLWAFNTMFPDCRVLMFGGEFKPSPVSPTPDIRHVTCPDGMNPVTFEIKRMDKWVNPRVNPYFRPQQ